MGLTSCAMCIDMGQKIFSCIIRYRQRTTSNLIYSFELVSVRFSLWFPPLFHVVLCFHFLLTIICHYLPRRWWEGYCFFYFPCSVLIWAWLILCRVLQNCIIVVNGKTLGQHCILMVTCNSKLYSKTISCMGQYIFIKWWKISISIIQWH